MKRFVLLVAALLVLPVLAHGSTVAKEDFDGGAIGLIGSSVTNLDGGPGDWFGVGNRNAWPQGFPSPGVPFSLADDTVIGYSNDGAPFAGDTEGIFGANSNLDNNYFALSDTREWDATQREASWTFNISGYSGLSLLVDMGGISNSSSGGFATTTDVVFTASIDGGPEVVVFDLDAVENPGFVTRPMDNGIASGGGRLLQVTGAGVVKLLAEDGTPATDTYLDKTPPSGPGAGHMDTFKANLAGTGMMLTVTMRADVPFEAMAFDNIVVEGNSAPDCSGALAVSDASWPPNHKLSPVSIINVTDPDGDPVTVTVTGITQDEPVNDTGDGNTCPDGEIVDGQGYVRLERSGLGGGRVYHISFVAQDDRGGSCEGEVTVCIPHDEGGLPCGDGGALFGSNGECTGTRRSYEEASTATIRLMGMQSSTATIEYALPTSGHVSLAVYDVTGRRVAMLDEGDRNAGTYRASWSPGSRGQGIYFYRLQTDQGVVSRSILHTN